MNDDKSQDAIAIAGAILLLVAGAIVDWAAGPVWTRPSLFNPNGERFERGYQGEMGR